MYDFVCKFYYFDCEYITSVSSKKFLLLRLHITNTLYFYSNPKFEEKGSCFDKVIAL